MRCKGSRRDERQILRAAEAQGRGDTSPWPGDKEGPLRSPATILSPAPWAAPLEEVSPGLAGGAPGLPPSTWPLPFSGRDGSSVFLSALASAVLPQLLGTHIPFPFLFLILLFNQIITRGTYFHLRALVCYCERVIFPSVLVSKKRIQTRDRVCENTEE